MALAIPMALFSSDLLSHEKPINTNPILPASICDGEIMEVKILDGEFVVEYDSGKYGVDGFVDIVCFYDVSEDRGYDGRKYSLYPYRAEIDLNGDKTLDESETYYLELEKPVNYTGREFII